MSDNDHCGRESASSKVRFHTQGKESKGSYASSSRSVGKSSIYCTVQLFFLFFASQTLRNIKQNIIYKKKIPAM